MILIRKDCQHYMPLKFEGEVIHKCMKTGRELCPCEYLDNCSQYVKLRGWFSESFDFLKSIYYQKHKRFLGANNKAVIIDDYVKLPKRPKHQETWYKRYVKGEWK